MFSSKNKSAHFDRSNAHTYLPDFMFSDKVSNYERWCVELMYLVREATKDQLTTRESQDRFSDDFMKKHYAEMFVMDEASIAMDTFLENLIEYDIKVPLHLLEPLIAVAKHIVVYGTTPEQLDKLCKLLLANAKTVQ